MNLEMRNEIEPSKLETVEFFQLYHISFSCLFCFPFVSSYKICVLLRCSWSLVALSPFQACGL